MFFFLCESFWNDGKHWQIWMLITYYGNKNHQSVNLPVNKYFAKFDESFSVLLCVVLTDGRDKLLMMTDDQLMTNCWRTLKRPQKNAHGAECGPVAGRARVNLLICWPKHSRGLQAITVYSLLWASFMRFHDLIKYRRVNITGNKE